MEFKAIELETADEIKLKSLELAITSRCNFKCSYCGAYDLNERQVLTGKASIDIIKDLPHLKRLKLSGGEVLIRFDDCAEVVEYCASRGIETQINTNGTLLDKNRVAILNDAGLNVLHFSLDFIDAEEHARFYNVRETTFGKIIDSVRASLESPSIDTVVETIIFNETKDHLVDIHNFISDLGVRKQEIQMEIPGVHQGYTSTIPPEELVDLIDMLIENRREGIDLFFSCISAYVKPTSPHYPRISRHYGAEGVIFANCIEGKSQLHIHSTGDVMICELGAPEVIGNVFVTPLLDLIQSRPEKLMAFIRKHHGEGAHVCLRNCSTPYEVKPPRSLPVLS